MKEILENIVMNLVDDKENVVVNCREDEKNTDFEVRVAENDMGKIIGRQGKIAKAIRIVMKSLGSKEHKKVTVEFID